jgi:hypothetical protein
MQPKSMGRRLMRECCGAQRCVCVLSVHALPARLLLLAALLGENGAACHALRRWLCLVAAPLSPCTLPTTPCPASLAS